MPWLIGKLERTGSKMYQWRVSGMNTEAIVPEPFSWTIPASSLMQERYVATTHETEATLAAVRGELRSNP